MLDQAAPAFCRRHAAAAAAGAQLAPPPSQRQARGRCKGVCKQPACARRDVHSIQRMSDAVGGRKHATGAASASCRQDVIFYPLAVPPHLALPVNLMMACYYCVDGEKGNNGEC